MMAKEMKRDSTNGVLVTSVQSGGPAGDALPPVASDDVIVEVAGKPVGNVAEFEPSRRNDGRYHRAQARPDHLRTQ